MADGLTTQTAVTATIPDATKVATDDAGAAGHVQFVKLASPADGSAAALPGDTTNGLDVDVTRTPKGSKTFSDPAPTTTATLILAANSSRKACTIQNVGTVTVYLGKDNTVTATSGQALGPNGDLADDVSSDAWWGITASGTADLRVCEVA